MMSNAANPRHLFDALTEYEARHLLEHLSACGQAANVHRILSLEEGDGRSAWYLRRTREGTDADFQGDVDLAIALTGNDAANSSLILKARYQIISGSLSAIHHRFPASFIAQLVRTGSWSARRALDAIYLLSDGSRRAHVLEKVLPYIAPEHRRRLVELAKTLPQTDREISAGSTNYPQVIVTSPKAELLAQLSGWFRDGDADALASAAVEAALGINDRRDRARCLGRLLPHLSACYQQEAATAILAIADLETNPERAYLTLPVLKHCPDCSELILPRIRDITIAGRSYYSERSLHYLKQMYQVLAGAAAPIAREALAVAVQETTKGAVRGLLEALVVGDIDPKLILEITSNGPGRMNRGLEREWVPLFARVDMGNPKAIAKRLASLRHGENRIEFYIRVRASLCAKMDLHLLSEFVDLIPAVRSIEDRVRLAATLLATGRLPQVKAQRLTEQCVEAAATIRHPPPRLVALFRFIDAYPNLTNAFELAIAAIAELADKPSQADAWLNLARRIEISPAIASQRPWDRALRVLRNISPQKSRVPILIELITLRPSSCFDDLRADIWALDAEFRVRTIVRSMPYFDVGQKREAVRWIVDMIKRARDAKTQNMVLSRSAEILDLDALSELVTYFRSIADNKMQYDCLGKVARSAPTDLVPVFLSFLLEKSDKITAIESAIAPVADVLTGPEAGLALELTSRGASPLAQAETFRRLSTKLSEADHRVAIQRALAVKQRVVKLDSVAAVVDGLLPSLLDQFEGDVRELIPASSRLPVDHSAEPLISALCKSLAERGLLSRALQYLVLSTAQEEHILGIAKYVAGHDGTFYELFELSRSIFNLEAKANIQFTLLVWRAKLGSLRESFQLMRTLDSYCMPIVASGLSFWLGHDQIHELLNWVDAIRDDAIPRLPANHLWDEDDQKSLSTSTMISGGYFASAPTDPVSAEVLVPALLPRLIELGSEDEAWRYVHYASGSGLAHFITTSSAYISDQGLLRMVNFARSLSDRSDFVAAVGALAIEFTRRGNLVDARRLIDFLPIRLSQIPNLFRHQRVGQMVRSQLRLGHPAETILPTELSGQLTAPGLANHPRMAIAVACLASATTATASEFVDQVLIEIANSGTAKLEAEALEYLAAQAETLPTSTIRSIADWALGMRPRAQSNGRRVRGDVLAIVGELAPVLRNLEGEQGVVALYRTVQQVCRWWE